MTTKRSNATADRALPLTFNDMATLYDSKVSTRKARTLPMDAVVEWASTQPEVRYDEKRDLFFWSKP